MHRKLPSLILSSVSLTSLVLLLLLISPARVQAQAISSFTTQVGVPDGQFSSNLENDIAWGIGFQHFRQLGQGPLFLGAGYSMMTYGGDSWDEYWAIGESVYDAEYSIENCIMDFEAKLRLQPEVKFPIQPYGEVFAGLSTISTTFSVTDNTVQDDCNNILFEELLNRDWGYTYGAGFGLMVPLCSESGISLDMGAVYRNSSRMNYMNYDFDRVFSSRTDMWLIRMGITVQCF